MSDKIQTQQTPEMEKHHVHEVYERIADHFSGTRHKGWPLVEQFISEQPCGSIFADVGCGNGKYLGVDPVRDGNISAIGCELESSLLSLFDIILTKKKKKDLSDQANRESLWNLEVIESQQLLLGSPSSTPSRQ